MRLFFASAIFHLQGCGGVYDCVRVWADGRMVAWVYDCRDVRVYVWEVRRVMSLLLSLGYLPRDLGVYEGEHHICERNENHQRPEPAAGKRYRHRSSERSAHNVLVKTAGAESVTRKCADKKVPDTAIYAGMPKCTYVHRTKRHSHSQRHRQQGSRPYTEKGTGIIIDTETGNVMGQGR